MIYVADYRPSLEIQLILIPWNTSVAILQVNIRIKAHREKSGRAIPADSGIILPLSATLQFFQAEKEQNILISSKPVEIEKEADNIYDTAATGLDEGRAYTFRVW